MLTTWRRPSQSSKVCLFKINQLHIISQMQHVLWIQHLNSFYKFMTVLLWIGKVPYLAVEKRFKIASKWSRVVHIISVSKQCSTLELKLYTIELEQVFASMGCLVLKCTRDWAGYNIISIKFCAIFGLVCLWRNLHLLGWFKIMIFFNILLFFGLLVLVGASAVGLVYIHMSKAAIMWQKQN